MRGASAGSILAEMPRVVRMLLVVEDDPELRRALADLLESDGYWVLSAADPVQALELLSAGPRPAAILLDLLTPRMTGQDFFARLRRNARLAGIPVITMTGEVATLTERPRTERFLAKPFTISELRAALASVGAAPAEPEEPERRGTQRHA